MRLRSLLFVPGDSERKFTKASNSNADALILDLEDAVVLDQKPMARKLVSRLLDENQVTSNNTRTWKFIVRINDLTTGLHLQDLAAIVRPGLDAILVPKANGAHDIERISYHLDGLEQRAGMEVGAVKIVVVSTETAQAVFNLGSYAPAHPRLIGLTWGAEDLGAVVGSSSNKEENGEWTFPYKVVKAQCLFAAAAAQTSAIDTLYANFKDPEGLAEDCKKSRRDGFVGRIAIHPAQVDIINECFSPSEEELIHARQVVKAFADNPDLGTVGIDGKMYDIPHLKSAERILAK